MQSITSGFLTCFLWFTFVWLSNLGNKWITDDNMIY